MYSLNDKILDKSKLKTLADNKINVTEKFKFLTLSKPLVAFPHNCCQNAVEW